jgi:hypothetical protein
MTKMGKTKKRRILMVLLLLLCFFLFFRLFLGIFVIQPIGAFPEGATIIYWRSGLNMPFISSPDGLLEKSGAGVSLLGRGIMLGGLAEPIINRKIISLPYSKTLYLWSTGGKEYE